MAATTRLRYSARREKLRAASTPSLRPMLVDDEWIEEMWADARDAASKETGIRFADFPDPPWTTAQVLAADFWPE